MYRATKPLSKRVKLIILVLRLRIHVEFTNDAEAMLLIRRTSYVGGLNECFQAKLVCLVRAPFKHQAGRSSSSVA